MIFPAFSANTWDVFRLRQFFMTLPIELDDAARIDGAGPFQILWHVILPGSYPVIAMVAIFSVLYAMTASVLMLIPPVLLFFFAQKLFIQGVVVSGIKG